jgi:hypothetical protein
MKRQQAVTILLAFLGSILIGTALQNSPVGAKNSASNYSPPLQKVPSRYPVIENIQPSLKSPPIIDRPTDVTVGFTASNIDRINQSDETFDISGFLSLTWQDRRLKFNPDNVKDRIVRHNPDLIWEPKLTILNSQSSTKRGSIQLTAKPDGTIEYLEQINTTVSSDLKLKKFPFDSQTAKIIWEPAVSDTQGVTLKENPDLTGYSKDSYVSLSEWKILGINSNVSQKADAKNRNRTQYTFEIKIKRHFQFYLFKVFLPWIFIMAVSWTTFWMNPNTAFVPQMNVGLTSILTSITFNFSIANSLPRISYMTLMDAYIFVCYIFLFASIMATVTCHFRLNYQKRPENLVFKTLQRCRWIFPIAFIGCQFITMSLFLFG